MSKTRDDALLALAREKLGYSAGSAEEAIEWAGESITGLMETVKTRDAEIARLGEELEDYQTPRPESEYHEDCGTVLWWHVPVCEPPYVGSGPGMNDSETDGSPTDCRRLIESGWLTHWTPIPNPIKVAISPQPAQAETGNG